MNSACIWQNHNIFTNAKLTQYAQYFIKQYAYTCNQNVSEVCNQLELLYWPFSNPMGSEGDISSLELTRTPLNKTVLSHNSVQLSFVATNLYHIAERVQGSIKNILWHHFLCNIAWITIAMHSWVWKHFTDGPYFYTDEQISMQCCTFSYEYHHHNSVQTNSIVPLWPSDVLDLTPISASRSGQHTNIYTGASYRLVCYNRMLL